MRRIAIINQKGGVGKTTTTVNVAAALSRMGHRVLLIDLDPQSHLTLHLGLDPASGTPGVYELLTNNASIAKARVKVTNNLWVVGASIDLAAAEVELVTVLGREVILRDALDQHVEADRQPRFPKYDYVIIDCPPSLGLLTLNGLCAAEEVIIPLQPHYLALQGVGKLLETVMLVGKRINPKLRVAGVAICMYDAGTKLAAEVVADMRSFLEAARGQNMPWSGARLFETVIRRNIKLAESPSYGKSIFDYAPDSNGARDYDRLAREVHEPAVLAGATEGSEAKPARVNAGAAPSASPEAADRVAAKSSAEEPAADPAPVTGAVAAEPTPSRSDASASGGRGELAEPLSVDPLAEEIRRRQMAASCEAASADAVAGSPPARRSGATSSSGSQCQDRQPTDASKPASSESAA